LINLKFNKFSPFEKNFYTLTIGTTLAQAIPFAFYPILSRIYNPEEFGFFYGVISIVPILTILSSGMFEHAILVAENDRESNAIIKLILIRSIILLVLFSILGYAFITICDLFDDFKINPYWIIITCSISFFTIIYNVFNEWSIRIIQFKNLALNKIYNSSFTSFSKILFKYCSFLNNGLIIGEFIGKFLTALICLISMLKFNKSLFGSINKQITIYVYKKYKKFPKFMMPDQLINTIGGSAHVYIIGIYFTASELGFLSMALSLLTVPVTVISSSLKDVFRQKANELYIESGSCRELYVKLLKPIFAIGLILFTILYFSFPIAFPFFLGEKWLAAGNYAQILTPMFFLNFVSMSLGGVLIISNQIKVSLYWQVFNVATTVISLLIGSIYFNDIFYTLIFFTIAKSISYIIYILLSYSFSKKKIEA